MVTLTLSNFVAKTYRSLRLLILICRDLHTPGHPELTRPDLVAYSEHCRAEQLKVFLLLCVKW